MPQWATGVLVGVVVAWATQWIQTLFKRDQYRHEKLMDRYAEFVAAAVAEIQRAKSQQSAMALGTSDQDFTEYASQLDTRRHSNRLELLRLSFQIRLLEMDHSLSNKVEELAESHLFMPNPFPPSWCEGDYNERYDRFLAAIASFEKRLQELTKAVVAKHRSQDFSIEA